LITMRCRTLAEVDEAAANAAQVAIQQKAKEERRELAKARRERKKRKAKFIVPPPVALPWITKARLMARR
jgi:hypothetical protein